MSCCCSCWRHRCPWPRAQAPKTADPPKTFDLAAIDAYVAAQVRDEGYAGLSLTIMREGKVVMAKGYGKRLLEPGAAVEPDTPFAVGSVTKQFTCACVLLLAEEGKLSIDDKVAKYEPSLTRAGDITLHDLMTHISGYPDFYPLDFVDRRLHEAHSRRGPAGGVRRRQARLRAGLALVVQQYGLHALGPCRRQGEREAIRAVPQGTDSRSAGHDAFRLRAGPGGEGADQRATRRLPSGRSSPRSPRPTAGCTPPGDCGPLPRTSPAGTSPSWRAAS